AFLPAGNHSAPDRSGRSRPFFRVHCGAKAVRLLLRQGDQPAPDLRTTRSLRIIIPSLPQGWLSSTNANLVPRTSAQSEPPPRWIATIRGNLSRLRSLGLRRGRRRRLLGWGRGNGGRDRQGGGFGQGALGRLPQSPVEAELVAVELDNLHEV